MAKLTKWVVPAMSLVVPLLAGAQTPPVAPVTGSGIPASNVTTVTGIFNIICALLGWMFILFIILAVVFVIVAAFKYLTAGGDAEKVGTANHMLIYAVVAVAVAVLARAIPVIVANFFNASAGAALGVC